jgi:hypothetical protein
MKPFAIFAVAGLAFAATTAAQAQDAPMHGRSHSSHASGYDSRGDSLRLATPEASGPTYTNRLDEPGAYSDRAPDEPEVFLHAEGAHI